MNILKSHIAGQVIFPPKYKGFLSSHPKSKQARFHDHSHKILNVPSGVLFWQYLERKIKHKFSGKWKRISCVWLSHTSGSNLQLSIGGKLRAVHKQVYLFVAIPTFVTCVEGCQISYFTTIHSIENVQLKTEEDSYSFEKSLFADRL